MPKYYAEFDPEKFSMHYKWTAPEGAKDLTEMQEYAMRAIRYIFSYLKPRPNEAIYIEYGVREDGRVYFIEANDSVVLTGK